MASSYLTGIKPAGSSTAPVQNQSGTLNLNPSSPALKFNTPVVLPKQTTVNPANSFNPAIDTPKDKAQAIQMANYNKSVVIPKKISSDVISYTAPTTTTGTAPFNSASSALNNTVQTYAEQKGPVEKPLTDRELALKDRQTAFDSYYNKDTGYGATSLKLQNEAGLQTKESDLRNLDIKDLSLQKQQKDMENEILNKNSQGLFGGAGQQLINQNQRDISSRRADLAIEKLSLQGDIKGATDLIKLKLDAQFEPVKERLNFLEKSLTIYGNDMSESQKSKATAELYKLKEAEADKDAFDKITNEALQNGATQEEVNNAKILYSKGDTTGAVSSISKYGNKSGLTTYQQLQATQSIAKDVQMRTANAREMARQSKLITESYNNIVKGGDRSLNTQAIITSFNKILDPTSVVRESEYDRTAQGQSLISRLQGKVDNIIAGGAGVTENTLKEAKDIADTYLKSAQSSINAENERAKELARQFGLNENSVTSQGYQEKTTSDGVTTKVINGKVLPTSF